MSTGAETAQPPWTIRRILEWTAGYLREQGSETPRLDAEVLLAHASGRTRIQLYVAYDEVLDESVRARMRDLVRRRAQAEPVAYLVGYREFFSNRFLVTPGVFIPRPETESLVMEALDRLKVQASPRVLDLCTGTGCIAISLAKSRPDMHVTAVELDPQTLNLARENARLLGVDDRVEFLEGDLFAPLHGTAAAPHHTTEQQFAPDASPIPPATAAQTASTGRQFDLVVSNPPYIASEEIPGLQPDVARHEPHLALDGGPEGLDILRRLICEAPGFLRDGGWLLMEIGSDQAEAVRSELVSSGWYDSIDVLPDPAGLPRVARGRKRSSIGPPADSSGQTGDT